MQQAPVSDAEGLLGFTAQLLLALSTHGGAEAQCLAYMPELIMRET